MSGTVNFAGMFGAGEPRQTFKAGEVLIREEEAGNCLYVLMTGTARINVGNRTLELVEPGGIFGEMALVDKGPRSATVTAETDCEVVAVDEKRFEFLVQQTPFFAREIIRLMATRLRAMNKAGIDW